MLPISDLKNGLEKIILMVSLKKKLVASMYNFKAHDLKDKSTCLDFRNHL